MPTETKKEVQKFLQSWIAFPEAPKKAKDRLRLFNEISKLIETNKDSFPAKLICKKRRKEIVLDSDDYMLTIYFGKQLTQLRIMANNPSKNMAAINKMVNSTINFLNTLLGDQAKNSKVSVTEMIPFKGRPVNIAQKIVGTGQLTKINEITKESLNPIAIAFKYKKDERDFIISTYFSKKRSEYAVSSQTTFKDKLPFDLLQKEDEKLNDPIKIIEIISKMES